MDTALFDNRYFEFVQHHWILVGLFVLLLGSFLMNETRRSGKSLSSSELVHLMNRDKAVVLDVRDKADYSKGHIRNSLHIPLSSLKQRISELKKIEDKQIVVVDKGGQHGGTAIKTLNAEGLTNVIRLRGGIESWKGDSLPLARSNKK